MGNQMCCSDANNTNADNTTLRGKQQALPFNKEIREGSFIDRSYGCILGSLLANSCGSFNDTDKKTLTHRESFKVMGMPGGGYHNTGSGQITDDGEMAMALMWAIVESNKSSQRSMQGDLAGSSAGERVLDTDIIATYYQKWLKSEPFNIDASVFKSLNMLEEIPKAKLARFIA